MSDSTAFEAIRAALVTQIQTVADIGQVYNRARWAPTDTDYIGKFTSTISGVPTLRAWWLTLDRIPTNPSSYGQTTWTWTFTVHGVEGFKDDADSEKTIVENAIQVMRAIDQLSAKSTNAVFVAYSLGPVMLRLHEHRVFGKELCDYVEIEVTVELDATVSWT